MIDGAVNNCDNLTMKTCTRCKLELNLDRFSRGAREKDGLADWCKGCWSTYQKSLRRLNPGYRKEYMARWRDANREKLRRAVADWQDANREKVRADCRRYSKENRDTVNALSANRRAAFLRAIPAWVDRKKIRDWYISADALNMWTGEWHHVDHIVPLQSKRVCGLHVHDNLQILPGAENVRKGNRFWPQMFEKF